MLTIDDRGRTNQVDIAGAPVAGQGGHIMLTGDNNRILLGPGCVAVAMRLSLGSNCLVEIGANCRLSNIEIHMQNGGHMHFGEGVVFTWRARFFFHEPAKLAIGRNSLIGDDAMFTVSDMHPIIDIETGQRINPAADILIGEHVWLGTGVRVLKGARIGRDSVIGMGSLVSGNIPANSVAAGAPARVIRSNVTWDGRLI